MVLLFGLESLELNRIYARHLVSNTASARVLREVGMKREGLPRERARNERTRGHCRRGHHSLSSPSPHRILPVITPYIQFEYTV